MFAVPAESTRPPRSVESDQRPELSVVTRRRRWPAVIAGFVGLLMLAAMLGAAVFHTQLAERQLEIDALSSRVQEERQRFDQLRLERSRLRAPVRLAQEAQRLGMVQAPQTSYLDVERWAFARQLAAAGPVSEGVGQIIVAVGPLEQFRDVKAVSAGQP